MKIAIPVNEQDLNSSVSASFGRTAYFLIYDTETKESSFVENSAAASTGGAGIKAAQLVVDCQADVLLTPRLGGNAADVLKSTEITIYKSQDASAQDNIQAFVAGKLTVLDEIHTGLHGRGNK